MWILMAEKKILKNRSWESMKERYRKVIKSLSTLNVTVHHSKIKMKILVNAVQIHLKVL